MLTPEPRNTDLLIVDDDEELRHEMADYLTSHGYKVYEAADVPAMEVQLRVAPIQLVILDIMLPGEDGLSACRRLWDREGPPVLILSAMGEDVDRILGLELGADDYLAKPVNPRELLARVRAMLRRRSGVQKTPASSYAFAGFRLDMTRRQLKAPDGSVLMLTPGEYSLLSVFLEYPMRILSRDQLMEYARGEGAEVFDRAIDVQISRLRRKLHGQVDNEIIKTHRGAGYMFDTRVALV
ncbi:MAG: response regulator [Caulobacteraceae bacterium]